jgi:hypothetical protein
VRRRVRCGNRGLAKGVAGRALVLIIEAVDDRSRIFWIRAAFLSGSSCHAAMAADTSVRLFEGIKG